MTLIQVNWNPSNRQLRQFGVICAVALPLVGWLWSAKPGVIGWLALVGVALAGLGWGALRTLAPIFIGMMLVTTPIGIVVGELAMFLVYVAVFLPIGAIFRILRRDRLQLHWDHQAASYWRPKAQPKSVASYYHQS